MVGFPCFFVLLSNIPFYVYSVISINGHYAGSVSWLLCIVLLWTSGCRYLRELMLLSSLNIFPEVELLDHMVFLLVIFWGTCILFSVAAAPIYTPKWCTRVLSSIVKVAFVVACLLDDTHSNRLEVISHFGFNLHFNFFWMSTVVMVPTEMV